MSESLDFDVHGLAGIRLLDAAPSDAAAVQAQLGLAPTRLNGEPDLVIRYVRQLRTNGPLRLLGLQDAGFTADAFLVLRGRYESRARVQIPFQEIGRRCEIVCEHGLGRVPLLTAIINLIVLGKGAVALHAAAFRFNGTGVLTTGWSKGGKTETLLAFMAHGAAYVGDEWVYLSPDGSRVFGLPEPIRLWSWHLESMPQYREAISRGQRARLRVTALALNGLRRVTAGGARHRSTASRTLNRVAPLLQKQLCVDIAPQRLFGPGACAASSSPDRVFFIASQEAPEVTVRPIDPREVARRMVFSLQEEQKTLMSYYWKYRFAFPASANALIDRSCELQEAALVRALTGKKAYEVRHPHPVELPALYDALRPCCV
jgi:hypothetical protein